MTNISEYFEMPRLGAQIGDNVFNTYAGSEKGCVFKFLTVKVLNQKETDKQGIEIYDEVDCVEYASDTKTRYTAPIDSHMMKRHPELYAHYQKWKEGRKADVTDIREWTGISHNEMINCMQAGFFFVEQIHQSEEGKLYGLGSDWKEIKRKADIFVSTKKIKKEAEEASSKFVHIEAENLSLKNALAEMQKQVEMLAQRQQAASEPKPRGRPKRKVDTSLVIENGASLNVGG